jgi:hypothetical protein
LFKALRSWQREYGYLKPAGEVGDLVAPCPYRDHYGRAREMAIDCHARPADHSAARALRDESYREKMVDYGDAVTRLFEGIWDRDYLGRETTASGRNL